MAYLDDVEKELRNKFGDEPVGNDPQEPGWDEWVNEIVSFVKGKLLESYKNGASAERQRKQKTTQKEKTKAPR